jgi:hypothetical protein
LNILQKETLGLFILKCGMSADTHALQKPLENVENLEGFEEELAAKG